MPYFLQVFLTLSPRPLVYGTVMYVLLFMGLLLLPLSPLFWLLDCLCTMVFLCALFKAHFGYLQAVREALGKVKKNVVKTMPNTIAGPSANLQSQIRDKVKHTATLIQEITEELQAIEEGVLKGRSGFRCHSGK